MFSSSAQAWAELESLDLALESAAPDQAEAITTLLDRRELAIASIARMAASLDELDELASRHRRVTEKFLHWRRVALVDLAQLDQHLRFLAAHPHAEKLHSLDIRA